MSSAWDRRVSWEKEVPKNKQYDKDWKTQGQYKGRNAREWRMEK